MSKTLIAYFSHIGENYFGGQIRNITKGNTEVAAEFAHNATGGTLYKIETVKTYPNNYKQCCDVAQAEGKANERPALKGTMPDIADYDTVILGYPCWWGTMPQAVFTFLESADFAGKKIMPFCTHEGSGMGRSESDIKKLCPDSTIVKGLAINGSTVNNAESAVKNWLAVNGLVD